jgi:hypothetical protein
MRNSPFVLWQGRGQSARIVNVCSGVFNWPGIIVELMFFYVHYKGPVTGLASSLIVFYIKTERNLYYNTNRSELS